MARELVSERLLLRRWRAGDRAPYAAMNADPRVREHFPGVLTREQSDQQIDRIEEELERAGFGFWALELRDGGDFIGFTGLLRTTYEAHFTPAVEIGWRLAHDAWGHGYATEAARVCLRFGFEDLGLDEIVALTPTGNHRSRAVMERIGMTRDPADDFDFPELAPEDPLARTVLYRLAATDWRTGELAL